LQDIIETSKGRFCGPLLAINLSDDVASKEIPKAIRNRIVVMIVVTGDPASLDLGTSRVTTMKCRRHIATPRKSGLV
jgi:hypothetical protein